MSPSTIDRTGQAPVGPKARALWAPVAAAFRPSAQLLLNAQGLWDGSAPHASFESWCVQHAGRACNLWVSCALMHELACEPDLPVADDPAALEWARGVLQHYHGARAMAWPLASWTDRGRRGVSALHGLDLASIQSTAQSAGVVLRGVRPWWSCVLGQALRRDATLRQGALRFLVVEAQVVLVISLVSGAVDGLVLRRLDAAHPSELQRSLSDGPACRTVAVGYGLDACALQGIECLSPLDALHPSPEWLGP